MRPLLEWLAGLQYEVISKVAGVPPRAARWSSHLAAKSLLAKLDAGRNSLEWTTPPYPLRPEMWRSLAARLRDERDHLPAYLVGKAAVQLLGASPEAQVVLAELEAVKPEWRKTVEGTRLLVESIPVLAMPTWAKMQREVTSIPAIVRSDLDAEGTLAGLYPMWL